LRLSAEYTGDVKRFALILAVARSVFHDGYIYGLDEAILACLDAATGEQKWKGGRYGYGQVLLAGDHLVVLAENGDVALTFVTSAALT
jgi:outer membrane protein assembly factor BamB